MLKQTHTHTHVRLSFETLPQIFLFSLRASCGQRRARVFESNDTINGVSAGCSGGMKSLINFNKSN